MSNPRISAAHFRLVLAVLALLFLASRVPDLARQSPFVDELATWERALAGETTRVHLLTFTTLRAALSLDAQSVFLLRLPSVLGWLIASVLLVLGARRIAGREGALMAAVAMVFLPIAQIHSQDANHYHWVAIAGAAALCAVEAATARRRCAFWETIGFVGIAGVCAMGHPVVVFVLAGMGLGILVGWALRPDASPVARFIAEGSRRAVHAILAIAAGGGGLLLLYREANSRAIDSSIGEGAFSLAPSYLLKLNTDLLGATQFHHPPAIATAAVLLLLSIVGWFLALRRSPLRLGGLAAAALISFVLHVVFVGLFDYGHFVYARYFIGLLPWAVVGWALLAREALRLGMPVRMAAKGAGALLVVSGLLFALPYHRGEYMAYGKALAWLDENATASDVLVTYKVYNSRGLAFWLRELDESPRQWQFLPLDFAFERAWTFYQQLEDLKRGRVQGEVGRVFYLHYVDGEESLNKEEYTGFLERYTRVVAEFPSRARHDLTPIRRDLVLREYLGKPERERPEYRFGAEISSRYPRSRVGMMTLARRVPILREGAMVEYRGLQRPSSGFVKVTLNAEKTLAGEPVILASDGALLGVYQLPSAGSAFALDLALSAELLPAGSEYSLQVLRPWNLRAVASAIRSEGLIAVQAIENVDAEPDGMLLPSVWQEVDSADASPVCVVLLRFHPWGTINAVTDFLIRTRQGVVRIHGPGDQTYSMMPVCLALWSDIGFSGFESAERPAFVQDPVLPGVAAEPRARVWIPAP